MLRDFLAGVRVLDLSQYLPGPTATQMLADMGADVLKVEPPEGDPLRRLDPVNGRPCEGLSPYYCVVNAGKRVVAIDLKSPDGKEAFAALVGAADALLESYRPGVLERLGFGRERLRALNPRLVHCALSGYGQTGSYRLTAGHDLNYVAFTGALSASGSKALPAMTWPPIADHASALQAALGVVGALLARERGGAGAYIDTSLAETVLAWQGWALTALGSGAAPVRQANVLNGGAAYYRVYATSDGQFVTLGAIEPHFWRNFCNAVGAPDWIARQNDPLPQTDLIAEVAQLFAGRSRAEWDALLSRVDCCYHPVLDYDEVPDHPQVAARRLIHRRTDPTPYTEIAFPAVVDGDAPPPRPPVKDITVAEAVATWRSTR
jgi:crotonobetainyl-CoA:carnitine CoA-transferase CaiB-like acyl-CoA transferase